MKKVAALVMLAVSLAACAQAAAQEVPGEDGITGFITDLSGTTVLIEANPLEQSGSEKASVEMTAETQIFRQQGQERVPATPEDLEIGQKVEATFVGPVAESYPVQATAGSITILKDPDVPGGAGDPTPSGALDVLPDTGGAAPPPVIPSAGGAPDQAPVNRGGRFSTKAAMPSFWSSVEKAIAKSDASCARFASWSPWSARFVASFAYARATGLFSASRAAVSRVLGRRSAGS